METGRKGATKHCCYGVCNSDSRRNNDNCFFFMPFPKPCPQFRNGLIFKRRGMHVKNCSKCSISDTWLRLCRPKFGSNLKGIPKDSYICSLHFRGESGPSEEYPDPIQFIKKRKDGPLRTSLDTKYKRTKSPDATPPSSESVAIGVNLNCPEQEPDNAPGLFTENIVCSSQSTRSVASVCTQCEPIGYTDAATQTEDIELLDEEKVIQAPDHKKHQDSSTQTTLSIFPHMKRLNGYKSKCNTLTAKLKNQSSMHRFEVKVRHNEKQCFFYCGLVFPQILALLTFLGRGAECLRYWQSHRDSQRVKTRKSKFTLIQELLLVLMRLRRGFLVRDLAYRFDISVGQVTKLSITWIQFMNLEFTKLKKDMFPSRQQISVTLPSVFKRLKNIRVLVDCTEIFCESPSHFEHQGNLYSHYKGHTTFKVLIGCTPNGAISFVSDLYEGSISDRHLFDVCGIVDLLDDGDLVLADRGFTVEDIVQAKGAHLNIPPFLRGRSKLTAHEEIETKKIAKERIYVEHAIGRLKKFRLLTRVLPLNMRGMIAQIVFVCACLSNFQRPSLVD